MLLPVRSAFVASKSKTHALAIARVSARPIYQSTTGDDFDSYGGTMWSDRTLEADIEYAAEMGREGLATAEQAAHACGIPLASLQAHLTGTHPLTAEHATDTSHALKGS